MLEGTAMQTLINFHNRYPPKGRGHRVGEAPMRRKKT